MILLTRHSLLLLLAASLLAACSTDTTAEQAQAKVDSIVHAKVTALQTKQRLNNDSIINAMAAARADSLMGQTAPAPKQ